MMKVFSSLIIFYVFYFSLISEVPTSTPSRAASMLVTAKVNIFKTEPTIRHTKYVGNSSLLSTLDVRVKILPGTFNLTGADLWKVNLWGSLTPSGDGAKIGYIDQVLDDKQAASPLITENTNEIIRFKFKNTDVTFDFAQDICSTFNYVCARFTKFDLNDPRYDLIGVKRSGKPRSSNLVGCTKLEDC